VESFKTEAIILKRTNFGEADRYVSLFTRSKGKIAGVAKGIRKISSRRAAHLEMLNHSKLHLTLRRNIYYIDGAESISSYRELREDIAKIHLAYQCCELIEKLSPEGMPNVQVYDVLLLALNHINNLTDKVTISYSDRIIERFFSRVLMEYGYISKDQPIDVMNYAQQIIGRKFNSIEVAKHTL